MASKRTTLIIILAMWQAGFTILVFIIGIFFTHRIAGPIYKMKKHLRLIRDGHTTDDLYFRKGDHFQELADEFNKTIHKIRDDYRNDFVYLSEVNAYINNLSLVIPDDKKPVLNEINQRLLEIQKKFDQI
jgi:signal transduction histidine kinase